MKKKTASAKSRQGIPATFFDEPHPKGKKIDLSEWKFVVLMSATPLKKKQK